MKHSNINETAEAEAALQSLAVETAELRTDVAKLEEKTINYAAELERKLSAALTRAEEIGGALKYVTAERDAALARAEKAEAELKSYTELPFRFDDVLRGLVLFRTSNSADGEINFVSLTGRVDALSQSERDELASLMTYFAGELSARAALKEQGGA